MNDTDELERLQRLASDVGATEIATEATALLGRAREGRFYVACVGEFKRGKSTLINSLLNCAILPTGVVPVTSVPTVLRYGELGARVRQAGRWHPIAAEQLAEYVSQDGNPGNEKKIAGVEVFVPHALLQGGLCLVDTPGIGSVFDANTASTLDFLPHIDAAVVVVGADPPISGEELRFAASLAEQVDTLLIVLNKADRIAAEQRDEALDFTRSVLAHALGRPVEPIYQVSAIATDRGPAAVEGWHALVTALERLPQTSGRRLVAAATRRGHERLATRLAAILEEERRALIAPLAESDRRLAELAELAAGAERARRELEPLLVVEERELAETFERRRIAFLERTVPAAQAELRERFDGRLSRHAALELANEIARERLSQWLPESEQQAEDAYSRAVGRFLALARDFLDRVAASAAVAPDAMRLDEAVLSGLEAARGFYFTDLLRHHESPLPWAQLLDRLTPSALARPRRLAAARHYLEHLLLVNATRVESDLRDRVRESRQRLQRELDRVLRQVGQAAVRAAERGRATRAAGEDAVRGARARLERWLVALRDLTRR